MVSLTIVPNNTKCLIIPQYRLLFYHRYTQTHIKETYNAHADHTESNPDSFYCDVTKLPTAPLLHSHFTFSAFSKATYN